MSFHPEASDHVDRTIGLIHDCGCKAGLVFNPATPLDWLDHTLDKLDLVLVMSVNPGFGGQSFIPHTLEKLRAVRARIDAVQQKTGRAIMLEVDGGVKVDNIAAIARAGADTFVAGSAIFGTPDYAATIARMRAELAKAPCRKTGSLTAPDARWYSDSARLVARPRERIAWKRLEPRSLRPQHRRRPRRAVVRDRLAPLALPDRRRRARCRARQATPPTLPPVSKHRLSRHHERKRFPRPRRARP